MGIREYRIMFIILELLHPKCNVCLYFGKFNINHINVILSVFLQINLVYVRLFTETCKQTESSYKRYHIYHTLFTYQTFTVQLQAVVHVTILKINFEGVFQAETYY